MTPSERRLLLIYLDGWLVGGSSRGCQELREPLEAWSAAGYIAAYNALHQDVAAVDFEPLTEELFG